MRREVRSRKNQCRKLLSLGKLLITNLKQPTLLRAIIEKPQLTNGNH